MTLAPAIAMLDLSAVLTAAGIRNSFVMVGLTCRKYLRAA